MIISLCNLFRPHQCLTIPSINCPLQTLDVEQSVFPVRTPDREGFLGPLSDLLEEEITLPGEEEAR